MDLLISQKPNEDGSVLVAAVLFMIILTLIGMAAMNTSTVEQQIAANDKSKKIAFHVADSGVYAVPKLIAACISAENQVAANGIEYLDPSGASFAAPDNVPGNNDPNKDFYKQITDQAPYNNAKDVRINIDGNTVEVDVERTGTVILAGGGAEFGTGAEGLGYNSSGSRALLFRQDSFGVGPQNSASNIIAPYRLITDF